ncbi:pseudouridine-5'-phosphatase isoform X1 [Diachasma alloeum]|uniref:pseudouridine-5'-phosphatase isoform X1 n=1 Tax=Diachasma alloeum TaxID=454923 RepID=UPI0007381704|nr:pseudouridine-5'-phosphatase isoform X1 [Diachasma alloeum]XP_028982089.1 pseudouridine-5'-phosphatase isoform X1 [Diachasma alloeum]
MDNSYNKVTHVLFDMDGLLLDTEYRYTEIYNRVIRKYGDYTFTWNHKATTMGFHPIESAKKVIEIFNLPTTPDEFMEQLTPHYQELFPHSQLMPGAERILRHLHKHNIPIALATSSGETSYELKTKKVKPMFELFHHKVLGGSDAEVKNGKPAPDIFLVAARRFPDNPEPSKCLVFEDAPNGVQAALSAGMQVVMVPDPNLPRELTKKATIVLGSLEGFKPELFGLPPYDN